MRRGTISGRGQVVIPSEIREELHLYMGTKVGFEVREGVLQIVPMTEKLIDRCMGKYSSKRNTVKELTEDRAREDESLESRLKKWSKK